MSVQNQKEIAKKVVQGGGDYVLAVKDNQPHLLEDIQEAVNDHFDRAPGEASCCETVDVGHGRREVRTSGARRSPSRTHRGRCGPAASQLSASASAARAGPGA